MITNNISSSQILKEISAGKRPMEKLFREERKRNLNSFTDNTYV